MRSAIISLLLFLTPITATAAPSVEDIVASICNNADHFTPIHDLAAQSSLAPALVNVIKDVNQASCWSKASEVLNGLGPNAKSVLPEILDLVRESSMELQGPMRELQQAFAITAIPNLSGNESLTTMYSLMNIFFDGNTSPDLQRLISSTLANRFSGDASFQNLLRMIHPNGGGLPTGSANYSKQDIQQTLRQLKNTTEREADKWIQMFNRELKRLNRSRY